MNPRVMYQGEMMRIRKSRASDFEQLPEIFNLARSSAGCFSGEPVDPAGIRALTEGEEVYVAEIDNQIVGFASVWVADNFLHHLYVLPRMHGQGIGSGLLEYCGEWYGPLSLKCEVANQVAQRFYRKRGWTTGERGMGEDGVWERLYAPGQCPFGRRNHNA